MILALIVGAGRGRRLGGPIPKQYRLLAGTSVLRRTVLAFLHHPAVAAVQAVIHPDDNDLYAEATMDLDLPPPVMGGATRQESVYLGLEAVAGRHPSSVLIHDAVRPFIEPAIIAAVAKTLDSAPAVIAALPVADTLKRCAGSFVTATLDRADIWRAQTPQGFHFAAILEAHRAARARGPSTPELTDDSLVAEQAGLPVRVVQGSEDNFKITTEHDLERAERIIRHRHRKSRTTP